MKGIHNILQVNGNIKIQIIEIEDIAIHYNSFSSFLSPTCSVSFCFWCSSKTNRLSSFRLLMRRQETSFSLSVKVSQFDIRRVVPSVLIIIGPHSSNRIDSPNLIDGRSESGSGGISRGIFPPSICDDDDDDDNASAISFDPVIVMAARKSKIALVSRVHIRITM